MSDPQNGPVPMQLNESDLPSDDYERARVLMMGFIDDELSEHLRREFIQRCYEDPELAAELAQYRRLNDITNSIVLKEPEDYEYERFFNRIGNRIERRLGFILLSLGAVVVLVSSLFAIYSSPIGTGLKIGIAIGLVGLFLVASSVLRLKKRVRRLDRYEGVQR